MLVMFKSVSELQAVLLQKINREIQMGRVAGPYIKPPVAKLALFSSRSRAETNAR